MALPHNRKSFREYCLRQLGKPVIDINVADEQVDDRVEDALQFWQEYHFNGTRQVYLAKEITEQDKINRYLPLDENVVGINRIFQTGAYESSSSLFNVQYHVTFQEAFNISGFQMTHYYMALQHLNLIEDMLSGEKPIRFNEHTDRVYIDMDWDKVETDNYFILEAYKRMTPEEWPDIWRDRWLIRYATQLIKKQWSTNLKKYQGMRLPGDITFDAQTMYNEADDEIRKLEEEMIQNYSEPPMFMIG